MNAQFSTEQASTEQASIEQTSAVQAGTGLAGTARDAARTSPRPPAKAPIRFMGRRSTAAALVLGAALNASASFINTAFLQGEPTVAGYSGALAERSSFGLAGVLLNIVGIPLMLAGIVGLLQLASPKAPVVSRIALAATTIGMIAFLCMNGALVALYSLGAGGNAVAAAQQLTGTSSGMLAMLLPFLLGNAVGMVCTAIALLKSKATAAWIPISLLIFFVADFVLPATPFLDAHLIFVAFAAAAAWSVLRTHTQPFSGR
ncbi:hypothetical protein ART_3668 [Arthrobacter sp. PAMC 25486]|uniref:hypothetical protein n=1 Tax=Arthrobacter sp. PAMC 25486 TaxID=1494608 RepID=UPI000535D432|nr:hypothetical protein [Arthrobacter sp. PAMC 25486]AIY03267.1 hypothetical protein ART_3668 [Arthrobacter sp. PAMC 25486]